MNITELQRKAKKASYIKVTGRCQQEHHEQALAAGLTPDIVIEAAYEEIYTQIVAKGLLKSISNNGHVKETMPKIVRGDIGPLELKGQTVLQELQNYIERQPGVVTFKELEGKTTIPNGSLYYRLNQLVDTGRINVRENNNNGRTTFEYYSKKKTNPTPLDSNELRFEKINHLGGI